MRRRSEVSCRAPLCVLPCEPVGGMPQSSREPTGPSPTRLVFAPVWTAPQGPLRPRYREPDQKPFARALSGRVRALDTDLPCFTPLVISRMRQPARSSNRHITYTRFVAGKPRGANDVARSSFVRKPPYLGEAYSHIRRRPRRSRSPSSSRRAFWMNCANVPTRWQS
jgi:hypothetical protein